MKKRNRPILIVTLAVVLAIVALSLYLYNANALPLGAYYQKGTITISNGTQSVNQTVWIAQTSTQLATGMMWRQNFGGAYGMLFVFNSEQPLCFWMENTVIPLEQAWINGSGYVTTVYEAQPLNTTSVCAPGEYVLEVPANTPIEAGYRITFSR